MADACSGDDEYGLFLLLAGLAVGFVHMSVAEGLVDTLGDGEYVVGVCGWMDR